MEARADRDFPVPIVLQSPIHFFDKSRLIARELDREAEEARVEEANAALAEVEREHPEVELPPVVEPVIERPIADSHPYLKDGFKHFENLTPMVYKSEKKVIEVPVTEVVEPDIETANVTVEKVMFDPNHQGYINFEGKQTSIESLKTSHPHLILPSDGNSPTKFNFGGQFPPEALGGDMYMRTDARPHRLFKFNGVEWIHVNKEMNSSYLQSNEYVKYLIDCLNNSQYLIEMLTESEDEAIRGRTE